MDRCPYCGDKLNKSFSEINRAVKAGLNLYCNRTCSGAAKRLNKSEQQKKEEKSEYDKQFRIKNKEKIKTQKEEYCKTTEGRAMQKRSRDKRKDYHAEYIKTPEYRAWKKEYDKIHRAKKYYGELWESAILLHQIEQLIPNREVKQELELINKSQKRKRDYEKIKRTKFKGYSLGNLK